MIDPQGPDFFPTDGVTFEPKPVLPEPLEVTEAEIIAASRKPRLPRPGLLEAIMWLGVVLVARLSASAVMSIVAYAALLVAGSSVNVAFNRLVDPDVMIFLAGADQLLFVLMVVGAMLWRYRGRSGQVLNLTPPRPLHMLIVAGLVLPLSTLCNALYGVAFLGWESVTEYVPLLKFLDELNTMEQVPRLISGTSLTMLLLIIAVGPAVGEELLFRGILGRGLIARWGVLWGVLITSILFGLMHLHPAHALSVIPLGIAIHLIYLGTRSFWAPMLLHFLNNGFAVVVTKLATDQPDAAAAEGSVSPVLLLASLTAVIVLGAMLYRTRARYVMEDGTEWDPGYFTVEAPSPDYPLHREFGGITGRNLVTAGSAWLAFGLAFLDATGALAR